MALFAKIHKKSYTNPTMPVNTYNEQTVFESLPA